MKRLFALLACPVLAVFACGDDPESAEPTADGGSSSSSGAQASSSSSGGSSSSSSSSSGDAASSTDCHKTAQPDDATRFVVAARPYAAADAGTDMAHRFSTFSLTSAGTVTPVADFELGGYNTAGRIAFTPDGRLGAVALESRTQEDRGTVGVFRLDDTGKATVVHANYKGDFFASDAAFSPDGNTLFVVDTNTGGNGGGLYAVPVACDGTLGAARRVTTSTGSTPPAWAPGSVASPWRALVAADALEGAPAGQGLHLFRFEGATPTHVSSADVFGEQTLIQDIAWAPDGKHALFTAPNPNLGGMRVVAAKIEGDAPSLADEWDLDGSETVVASPYGNAFFVGTADPDGAFVVKLAAEAFTAPAPITLVHPTPQLPFAAHVIDRGALKGRVVMAELLGLRQFQFAANGDVTDVASYQATGADDDLTAIFGGMGVTP